jgi:hypothetical protein
MLFVEALLRHPHAVEFLDKIESVYDAASFGKAPTDTRENVSSGIESDDDDDDNNNESLENISELN